MVSARALCSMLVLGFSVVCFVKWDWGLFLFYQLMSFCVGLYVLIVVQSFISFYFSWMWIERQISIVKTLEPTPIPKFGLEGPPWKRKDEEEVEPLVAVF